MNEDEAVALGNPQPVFENLQELKAAVKARRKKAREMEKATNDHAISEPTRRTTVNAPGHLQPSASVEKVERLHQRVQHQEKLERASEKRQQRGASGTSTGRNKAHSTKHWPTGTDVIDHLNSDDDDDDDSEDDAVDTNQIQLQPPAASRVVQMLADMEQTRDTAQLRMGTHGKTKEEALDMNPMRGGNSVTTTPR